MVDLSPRYRIMKELNMHGLCKISFALQLMSTVISERYTDLFMVNRKQGQIELLRELAKKRGLPRGFGERGNKTIYFKGTMDVLCREQKVSLLYIRRDVGKNV